MNKKILMIKNKKHSEILGKLKQMETIGNRLYPYIENILENDYIVYIDNKNKINKSIKTYIHHKGNILIKTIDDEEYTIKKIFTEFNNDIFNALINIIHSKIISWIFTNPDKTKIYLDIFKYLFNNYIDFNKLNNDSINQIFNKYKQLRTIYNDIDSGKVSLLNFNDNKDRKTKEHIKEMILFLDKNKEYQILEDTHPHIKFNNL